MLQWKRDLLYGIVILLFCIVNFIYAGFMETGTIKIALAQPAPYMRLWLVFLGILSVLLIVKALRNKDCTVKPPIFVKTTFLSIGALVVYLFTMPYLGFLLSSVLFLFFIISVYSACMWKDKPSKKELGIKLGKYLAASIVIGVIVEQVFRNVLSVILPSFSLF